jgi:septum formation protein
MMPSLVLASASAARAAMLAGAGLSFDRDPARIDERAAEAPLRATGAGPADVAELLAEAKALDVSERHPGALVIGADQTLGLGDERFDKPADMEAARRQLLALSGRTHTLHSAVAVARDGAVLWRELASADLTMRPLTPAFIGHYLAVVGDAALASVGCYQLEGRGAQLFERIDGDYFTVLGLPLLPLLGFLRREGVIET